MCTRACGALVDSTGQIFCLVVVIGSEQLSSKRQTMQQSLGCHLVLVTAFSCIFMCFKILIQVEQHSFAQ